MLDAAHTQRLAADQRHREREGWRRWRPSGPAAPSIVTTTTCSITFNPARKAAAAAAGLRRRRAGRAIPGVHHRDARRAQAEHRRGIAGYQAQHAADQQARVNALLREAFADLAGLLGATRQPGNPAARPTTPGSYP